MINFQTDLINPIQYALNYALSLKNQSGAFVYPINDTPKNYRYNFYFSSDIGDMVHSYRAQDPGTIHDTFNVPINGVASINPVSLDGVNASTYNALIDASITFALPIGQVRGQARKNFINAFRQMVDDTLQSSQTQFLNAGGTVYQVGTKYTLLQTGTRNDRSSIGESVEYTLRLTFTVVAYGISSDNIELYVDGERVYFEHIGFARKAVKEMGEKSSDVTSSNPIPAQKSFVSSTYFAIMIDMPARFTTNPGQQSFLEKFMRSVIMNTQSNMTVSVKVPYSITLSDGDISTNYLENSYTMQFDTTGLNGETGLIASQSITLMEV